MYRLWRLPLLIVCLVVLSPVSITLAVGTVSVNDRVRLKVFSDLGVPLHAGSGSTPVSGRLPDGTEATVNAINPQNGWIRISAGDTSGWIIKKYIGEVLPNGVVPQLSYVVGCWNLEHFHDGVARGFPENTMGGPSYPARMQNDYETIASIIEQLEVRILVLEEIFAQEIQENGEKAVRSREIERLIAILGLNNYAYIVGTSGTSQHMAILYDKRCVRLNAVHECDFPKEQVDGKNCFDRQPLYAHFSFLRDGQPKNDLVVVGVHLASGQDKTANHDKAMASLVQELDRARDDMTSIPPDEHDILIAGDFNASRFDNRLEQFWDDMEGNGWDVLADVDAGYSATRLSGHPLKLGKSKIDYMIVTKGQGGLAGEEVLANTATVHAELVGQDAVAFRRRGQRSSSGYVGRPRHGRYGWAVVRRWSARPPAQEGRETSHQVEVEPVS